MIKKISLFLGLGLFWLFLFSSPVGGGKNLFDIANAYVVKSSLVVWMKGKIYTAYSSTLRGAESARLQELSKDVEVLGSETVEQLEQNVESEMATLKSEGL